VYKGKVVLVSHFAIPYKKIASWTNSFSYYVKRKRSLIDYIVSPVDDLDSLDQVDAKHIGIKEPKVFRYKMNMVIPHYKYFGYWRAIDALLDEHESLIVMVLDNPGLLRAIQFHSAKRGKRSRLKMIFFHHGYHYFFENRILQEMYDSMDELVVLTKSSYEYQLSMVNSMPMEVSHIYNGIDSNRFRRISSTEKKALRKRIGLDDDKIYFIWLSQDRPKKGLHIVLRAWDTLSDQHANIELLVIGTHREVRGKGIRWLGRIPNHDLPQYYQAADFYLFPTLWHEGFGLSLAEALKCGSVCIASNIDPVGEVMGFGRYGRVVDFPHDPSRWIEAIEEEMTKYEENDRINPYLKNIPEDLYDLDEWCDNIDKLVEKWKRYIQLPK